MLFGCACFAQEFSEEYSFYKTQFNDQPVVDLKDHQFLEIRIKDNDVLIQYDDYSEMMYLDRRAKFNTESSIEYSFFSQLKDIEAYSLSFERGKYRKNKVSDFQESDVTSRTFYDDIKEVKFIYPKLNEGAKSVLSYSKDIKDPRFLPASLFGSNYPLMNKKLEVTVYDGVEVDFITFHTGSIDIDYSVKSKRKKTIHTWEAKNIPAFEDQLGSISFKEYVPHIIPIIKSYQVDGEPVKVLGETQDLYNWYASLLQNLNQTPLNEDLNRIVNDITANATSDLEKVKAVYYWTQQNIKYLDVEYGLGGFIPREANQVFEQKYGDCKDNSSLMKAMLEELGIQTFITWVGTRKLPYTYDELPTPMVDNHMILTYWDQPNDKYYYLDATGRYLDFNLPSSFIQGKQVMMAIDDNTYKLNYVPYVEPEENNITELNEFSIESLNLVGTTTIHLSGYEKINALNRLENRKKDKKIDFYRNRFSKGSKQYVISNLNEISTFNYDQDMQFSFDFEMMNYVQQIDDQFYVNLNFKDNTSGYYFERINEQDIEIKHKRSELTVNKLKITEGFSVMYIPENHFENNPFFDLKITYQIEDGVLIYTKDFKFKKNRILKDEQEELKELIKENRRVLRESIALQKEKL